MERKPRKSGLLGFLGMHLVFSIIAAPIKLLTGKTVLKADQESKKYASRYSEPPPEHNNW